MFKENYKRRTKMFNALVALCGKEIWGWANDRRMDGLKKKYVKWILGLDRKIPNYILLVEERIKTGSYEKGLSSMKNYEEDTKDGEENSNRMHKGNRKMEEKEGGSEKYKCEKKRREMMEIANMGKEKLRKKRKEEERR